MTSRVQRWTSFALCILLCGGLCSIAATAVTGDSAGAASPRLAASPGGLNLGSITLGDISIGQFTVTNTSAQADTITDYETTGPDADDFGAFPDLDCPTDALDNVVLGPSDSCTIDVLFFPGALGPRSAILTLTDSLQTGTTVALSGTGTIGYYQVSSTGTVAHFGDATFHGDLGGAPLNHPIVGISATGDDGGYWLAASDGGIFNYGDAGFFGSAGGIALNKPIVGMASTIDAQGYWLVATDGGIFSYGDAPFYGSTGSLHLNKPIVGMATTPDGGGYWLVASDGGIFAYGDAQFYGSTGSLHLNKPIVGMVPTPDGAGYWLVASDGGIFAYGDAQFYGSTGNLQLNQPIVAMTAMPTGNGYWFTAADGGLFNYGDAPFLGTAAVQGIGTVVGMATDGSPTLQAQLDAPAIRRAHGTSGWAMVPDRPRYAGS
jgi:hypothetical protein